MDTMNKYGYYAKFVAKELDITTSTLRRWSIELESNGYEFERNDKDQRIYKTSDCEALKELQSLMANGVTISEASKVIVSKYIGNVNAPQTLGVQTQEMEQQTRLNGDELKELLLSVYEQGRADSRKELEEILQKQQQYINERLFIIDKNLSDRDEKIMAGIRELQEARREAAASQDNKGFFSKWFKKSK